MKKYTSFSILSSKKISLASKATRMLCYNIVMLSKIMHLHFLLYVSDRSLNTKYLIENTFIKPQWQSQ